MRAACTRSLWHILKGHTMQRDTAQEKAMCALLTQLVLCFWRCVQYITVSHGFIMPVLSRAAQLYRRLCSCLAASPAAQLWPPLLPCTFLLPHSPCHALPPALPKPFSINCYYFIQLQILNLLLNTLQWPWLLCRVAQETPS